MRNKKLLLVLGAGASAPYGLPTSAQLRELILGTRRGDEILRDTLAISVDRALQLLQQRFYSETAPATEIRKWFTGDSTLQSVCRSFLDLVLLSEPFDFGEDHVKEFRNTFRESDRVSIDSFINRWEDKFGDVARAAVAAFILLCERGERLNGDWYQVLNEAILRRIDELEQGDLRIINFNYD
jgi:hypothetical protein